MGVLVRRVWGQIQAEQDCKEKGVAAARPHTEQGRRMKKWLLLMVPVTYLTFCAASARQPLVGPLLAQQVQSHLNFPKHPTVGESFTFMVPAGMKVHGKIYKVDTP